MSTIKSNPLLHLFLVCIGGLSIACSSIESFTDQESDNKLNSRSGSPGYTDDLISDFDDPSTPLSSEDEAIVNQFLNTDLGELSYEDLTDGSVIVAGPGGGPEVVLGCAQGTLYVAAGVATGVLATAFAASGVVAAGGGVAATAPASVPIYATAGGLIGLGLSASSWGQCVAPLARMGLELISNGYFSVARGLQEVVFQSRRASVSNTQSQSTTHECKSGGKKCGDMTGRYKNAFCNPLNRKRDQLGINVHQNAICDLGGLGCADIAEIARLAAGCWKGRHAVTQRCFNGKADPGHRLATEYAEGDFFSCIDLSFDLGCGDFSIEDRLIDQAEQSYPECL